MEKWKINNIKKKNTDGNDACEIGKIGAMGIFSVLERVRMPSTGQRQNYNISGKEEGRVHYNYSVCFMKSEMIP